METIHFRYCISAMLSVFGRVTLVNISYQNPMLNDQLIREIITNASMEKGGFSSLKILNTQLHNPTGFTTVHYEIEVFEKSLPVSTNFTLSSEEFLESAINNGGEQGEAGILTQFYGACLCFLQAGCLNIYYISNWSG